MWEELFLVLMLHFVTTHSVEDSEWRLYPRTGLFSIESPQIISVHDFRFFYEFLLSNERHVAKEVRDEYVDTVSKVYMSYFKSYINRVMKLQVKSACYRLDLFHTLKRIIMFINLISVGKVFILSIIKFWGWEVK